LGYLRATSTAQLSTPCVPAPLWPAMQIDDTVVEELAVEEEYDSGELWRCVESLLPEEQERRLLYLLYYCGLKPREIIARFPEQFTDVREIYRINRNLSNAAPQPVPSALAAG